MMSCKRGHESSDAKMWGEVCPRCLDLMTQFAERQLKLRMQVCDDLVSRGRLRQEKAKESFELMQDIIDLLKLVRRQHTRII